VRVLFVAACPYPSPQGSQVYARGMARALARRGHTVTVACYAHGQGAEVDDGVHTVRAPRVPGYARMRSGPDPLKPVLDAALAARVASEDADVVHAHGQEGLAVALAARTLPRRGTAPRAPIVYNPHTLYAEELPTYLPPWLSRFARRSGGAADRLLPRGADACVALSRRTEASLRAAGAPRVVHVPPGVDPEDFTDVSPRSAGPGKWVVYAGNPDAYQDLPVLFAAMRRVTAARLLLVSSADWTGHDIGDAMIVRPADWTEARSWMAGADVAALPRATCAGFPIKLLNYAALGLPTVVAAGSAQGLPGEHVAPGGDAERFAAALSSVLASGARHDGGAVVRDHGWDARAAAIEALYRSLDTA
jgi:glycosyltransferase involved in cell wall biosynthesis